MPSTNQDKED